MIASLSPDEMFALLREFLNQPPSEQVWAQIKQLLNAWEASGLDLAIDYAAPHLEAWPDLLRTASLLANDAPHIAPDEEPCWPLVRHFVARDNKPPQETFAKLLERDAFSSITALSLEGSLRHPPNWLALCEAPQLTNVRALNINENFVRFNKELNVFCASACAQGLEHLHLDRNIMNHHMLPGLVEAGILKGLKTLSTGHSQMWDEQTCARFAAIPESQLRTLKMERCSLTDDRFALLLESPAMAHVEHLDLRGNHLSAHAIEALVASPLAQLKHLDMRTNSYMSYTEYRRIDDESLCMLLDGPMSAHLQTILLDDTHISEARRARLKRFNQRHAGTR